MFSEQESYFFFLFFSLFMAVPFDEDEKDPSVWFLDHDYLENMYGMFKKVNGMCRTDCLSTKFVWSNLLNMQGSKLHLIWSPMLLTFSPWRLKILVWSPKWRLDFSMIKI